jgi:hypothetical protein
MGQDALIGRTQRATVVTVTPELILELLKVHDGRPYCPGSIVFTKDPIPETSRVASCCVTERGDICLVIKDPSFPVTKHGEELPILTPCYGYAVPEVSDET